MTKLLTHDQIYHLIDTIKPSQLAQQTGISRQALYKLKNRTYRPCYKTIDAFSRVFGGKDE